MWTIFVYSIVEERVRNVFPHFMKFGGREKGERECSWIRPLDPPSGSAPDCDVIS